MKYYIWSFNEKTKVPKLIWESNDRKRWLKLLTNLTSMEPNKTYGARAEVEK